MKRKKYKILEEKLIKIACERHLQESLARILLESIRNNINLKPYDIEHLSILLLERIQFIRKDINYLHKYFNI